MCVGLDLGEVLFGQLFLRGVVSGIGCTSTIAPRLDDIGLGQFQLHTGFMMVVLSTRLLCTTVVDFEAELGCNAGSVFTLHLTVVPQFNHLLAAKALRTLRQRLKACDKLLSFLLARATRRLNHVWISDDGLRFTCPLRLRSGSWRLNLHRHVDLLVSSGGSSITLLLLTCHHLFTCLINQVPIIPLKLLCTTIHRFKLWFKSLYLFFFLTISVNQSGV